MTAPEAGAGDQLAGKSVIVTGAAQGIGACVAEAFARDGARVMLADIQEAKAADVAARLRDGGWHAQSTFVDITRPGTARKMVAHTIASHGAVDVLVNVAGLDAPPGKAWELGEEDWRRVIDADLSGPWWCTQAVLAHMMERRAGRIIIISSISARRGSPHITVAYNAAKSGLNGLVIGLSVQLEPYGILVNAVAPGRTGTGTPISPESRVEHERRLPLGIVGPEPVAQACLYLARPSGDWVSGTVMNVSGGDWRGP